MLYIWFFFWTMMIIAMSFLVNRLWRSIVGPRTFRIALLPGAVIHDLSYTAGVLLTGSTITHFRLMDEKEESLEHTSPPIPVLGQVFIALAPIMGCGVILFAIAHVLGFIVPEGDATFAANLSATPEGISIFLKSTIDLASETFIALFPAGQFTVAGIVFAVAAVSLTTFMAPAVRNFKFALLGAAIIAVGAFLFDAAGAKSGYAAYCARTITAGWSFVIFCAAVLVVVLGISLAAASIVYLVRAAFGKEPETAHAA